MNENNDDNCTVNNEKTTKRFFEYKTKIKGSTSANNNTLDTEVVFSLKYLFNFWRNFNLPLIKESLICPWSKNCIISEIFNSPEIAANPVAVPPTTHAPETSTTSGLFQINSTKFCVPVVTLSINDNIKTLKNLIKEFQKKVPWNK